MKSLVIPGILTQRKEEIVEKVRIIAPVASRVSIDIIDGLFADNWTISPQDLYEMNWHGLAVDMQLMVEEPVDWLGQVKEAGAERVFGHIERMSDRELFLAEADEQGLKVGWGVDLYTPIEELSDEELLRVDGLLLMSVKAGFSGQDFASQVLNKVKQLRDKGFAGDIVMDGGVNEETLPQCLEAGANQFSVTSALWESENVLEQYEKLQSLAEVS